ncbi:hypothetical protein F2Q69_00002013 [Brassica cretica]|uniref:Uncharacterized protein n=1 Tax=Brassica cretica TaxID=69181 RepID=A0A8S9PIP2_BRACR|nr:hypothetical protein F2Q69_00002013 [Brassica cretica]
MSSSHKHHPPQSYFNGNIFLRKIAILSTIFADLKSGRYSSSTSIHREGAQVLGSQKRDAPPGC